MEPPPPPYATATTTAAAADNLPTAAAADVSNLPPMASDVTSIVTVIPNATNAAVNTF